MLWFRLEILRELLPHGDQKRDKASFLLEVNRSPTFLQQPAAGNQRSHNAALRPSSTRSKIKL
jgi:hypothetical protein